MTAKSLNGLSPSLPPELRAVVDRLPDEWRYHYNRGDYYPLTVQLPGKHADSTPQRLIRICHFDRGGYAYRVAGIAQKNPDTGSIEPITFRTDNVDELVTRILENRHDG